MAKSILQPLINLAISVFTFLLCFLLGSAADIQTASIEGTSLIMTVFFISFAIHWVLFVPSYIFQTEKFYDLTGSLTYITAICFVLYQLSQNNFSLDARALIISGCVLLWTIRLGSFLFWRVLKDGEDKRFRSILPSFSQLFMTWSLSAAWVFIQLLSALVAITVLNKIDFGLLGFIGLGLWLFGFIFEVLADQQKTKFKSDLSNEGKFITTGLWSLSRHPNYFGEVVLWTGVSLMALPVMTGMQYIALISPIFTFLLIYYVSGVRMLEARANKKWGNDPNYKNYLEKTPIFVPKFPNF